MKCFRPLFRHFTASKYCSILDMLGLILPPMQRKLVWVKSENFEGFGCSNCNWIFKPPRRRVGGGSIAEMKRKYKVRCDTKFAAHVCAEHRTAINPKTK